MTTRTPHPRKVFTVRAHLGGNARGQVRAVVAAPTAAAAARAFGVSAHQLRTYGSETGNPLQIEVAMSDPGAVFFGPTAQYIDDTSGFTRWEPTARPGVLPVPIAMINDSRKNNAVEVFFTQPAPTPATEHEPRPHRRGLTRVWGP